MKEVWAEIPGYSDYAVSNQGRIWNLKLNKELDGSKSDSRIRVTMRNDQGGWDTYNKDQILNSVDFESMRMEIQVRKIRIVETGEIFHDAIEVAKRLLTDKSSVYKALKGTRPKVRGVELEYIYDNEAIG